jgi:hypothetical protein
MIKISNLHNQKGLKTTLLVTKIKHQRTSYQSPNPNLNPSPNRDKKASQKTP